ncbi:MAG: glycosyltransferase family 4 protein [Nitrososphaerales archaeon]
MKIAYLADCQSIHTIRWINYFKNKGHEVFVLTSNVSKKLDVKQYKLKGGIPIPLASKDSAFRYALSPYCILYVKKILHNEKPDILHAHYLSHYGFIGALVNYHPFVVTAWGSDVLLNPNQMKILELMVKFTLKRADFITCDGEHVVKIINNLRGEFGNISIIYFGTDVEKFNPKKRSEEIRSMLGAKPDTPIVISLRYLEPIYDVKTLIKAIPLVLKNIPEIKFIIAGSGSQEAELKRLVNMLKIANYVSFVGFIPNEELPKYLASSDIYVSTSLSDAGLAASTAEAMACGLPVIITDFGDNSKWVKNGVNGYLFPMRDYKALAERIIQLAINKDLRKEMGEHGRRIIEEKLNYTREMEKVERLYKDLIDKR